MESFALCKQNVYEITWSLTLISIYQLLSQWFSVCNTSHPRQKKSKVELENKATETALEIMSLIPRNYAKFTGEHLCQSLSSIKLQASSRNSIKKGNEAQTWRSLYTWKFIRCTDAQKILITFNQSLWPKLLRKWCM